MKRTRAWLSEQLNVASHVGYRLTLRSRLWLILLIALAPGLAIVIYNEATSRRSREAEARSLALTYANLAGFEIDRILNGIGGVLKAVGTVPAVLNFRGPDCDTYLSSLTGSLPYLTLFSATDADGRVRCSSVPGRVGRNDAASSVFTDAVAAHEAVFGTFMTGQNAERPVIPVSMAIRDSTGGLRAVIVTALDLQWLSDRVKERGLPPGGALAIADRNGVIIVREPDTKRFVGRMVQPAVQYQVNAKAPGTADVISQDGTPRFVGYIPSVVGPSGLFVTAGVSKAEALAPINRATTTNAIILSAGTLAAIAAAWLAGYAFIRRQIEQLVSTIAGWRSGDTARRTLMKERSGEIESVGAAFDNLMDDLAAAQRERNLLTSELRHRIKNTLATVQAIASQTFHSAAEVETFRERLQALARSLDFLTAENWKSADLGSVIDLAVRPFRSAGGTQITADGPKVRINAKAALSLAMALHELATNALKYGALTSPSGTVDIRWSTTNPGPEGQLRLTWVERGGPLVRKPATKGFGSRLISRALAAEFHGTVDASWEDEGVAYTISAPLASIVP